MNECSACHVDYYYNPDVRVFYSTVCDHLVCEPCISRLFRPGPYKCPACERQLVAGDFSREPREAKQVEAEVKVRRQVCEVFCKSEEDFQNAEEYNEYLMQREDMIYRLTNTISPDEVQAIWRQVDRYREQNAEQIRQARRMAPRKKFKRIVKILEEEGAFYSSVNSEWGEAISGAAAVGHPFLAQYHSLLSNPDLTQSPSPSVEMSPPPQPAPQLMTHGSAQPVRNAARHMSGGGYRVDACMKKARHFLFADLANATSAVASAA